MTIRTILYLLSFTLSTTLIANNNWLEQINYFEAMKVYKPKTQTVIALIDTGLYSKNYKNSRSRWINYGEQGIDSMGKEKATNGIDDDNNGYIDDFHGWNFLENNHNLNDKKNHGSVLADIIAGEKNKRNNHLGGLNSTNIKIMGLKALTGNTIKKDLKMKAYSLKNAIIYAVDNGAHIINASWSTQEQIVIDIIEEAVQYASKNKVLIITSSSNWETNIDTTNTYPSAFAKEYDNILSVASLDKKGEKTYYSGHGKNLVQTSAPGSAYSKNQKYKSIYGTSITAAIISGSLALLRNQYPSLNSNEIKNILLSSSDKSWKISKFIEEGNQLNLHSLLKKTKKIPDWNESWNYQEPSQNNLAIQKKFLCSKKTSIIWKPEDLSLNTEAQYFINLLQPGFSEVIINTSFENQELTAELVNFWTAPFNKDSYFEIQCSGGGDTVIIEISDSLSPILN